jgi:hypothetical protein
VQAWLRRRREREEIEPAFTPHDLRRTFATRLSNLGVMPHIVEKILNHTLQGVGPSFGPLPGTTAHENAARRRRLHNVLPESRSARESAPGPSYTEETEAK